MNSGLINTRNAIGSQKYGGAAASDGREKYEEVNVDIGNLRLKIYQGDITQANAEAIVNGTNAEFDLTRGKVSSAILAAGGQEIKDQVRRYGREMKTTGIAVTVSDPTATGMPCDMIIHVNAEERMTDWKFKFLMAMKKADEQKCKSVAFPALGTAFGSTPEEIAGSFVDALVEFIDNSPDDVKEVHMVIYQRPMVQKFITTMESSFQKYKKAKGFMKKVSNYIFGSGHKDDRFVWNPQKIIKFQDKFSFAIIVYGHSQSIIADAISALDSHLQKNFKEKLFEEEIIKSFSRSQERQANDLASKYNIEVTTDIRIGRIRLIGLLEDLSDASDKLHGIIRDAEKEKQAEQEATLIDAMVQWHFIDVTANGNKLEPYPSQINRLLEKGYRSQQTHVKFPANNQVMYVVDLNALEEYPENQPTDVVSVIRKCKMEDSSFEPPSNWSSMTDTENVTVVVVQPADAEFVPVQQNFQASLGGQHTIIKIERIQNRTLYQQYVAKKKLVEAQNVVGTQNERSLWHGTAPETVDSINTHGFNRSYCGKNATVHGDGVYFAVNSAYSAQPRYSRPDASGHRRMYQCKVLTGEFTLGQQGMRVPPSKAAAHVLYDSVVDNQANPGMFIIFNDTQAYPEYLVTFQ